MQLHEKFDELRDLSWVDLVRMQQQQIEMLERLVAEASALLPATRQVRQADRRSGRPR
jgi:hypothetical protein